MYWLLVLIRSTLNLRSSVLLNPFAVLMYSGTCTVSPVESVAGLVRDVAEAPLIDGLSQQLQALLIGKSTLLALPPR